MRYNAQSPLLTIHDSQLDILATPKTEYPVYIRESSTGDCSGHGHGVVTVKAHDQVVQLKKYVRNHLGLLENCQMVSYKGRDLKDSAYLFEECILEDCTVTVAFRVEITFRYKQAFKRVVTAWDGQMLELLERFAEEENTDLSTLRFILFEASGKAADCALDWLPDRAQLFKAKQVAGTVKENGLMRWDEIQVFQANGKRKRDDEAEDQDCEQDGSQDENQDEIRSSGDESWEERENQHGRKRPAPRSGRAGRQGGRRRQRYLRR